MPCLSRQVTTGRLLATALATAAPAAPAQSGWTNPTPAIHPSARAWHSLAYDLGRGVVVLFGGATTSTGFGDTWEWNGATWTARSTVHSPSARYGHAFTYDLVRSRVLLFGGGGAQNDTWEYDGSDWTQRQPNHTPSRRVGACMACDLARACVILFGGHDGTSVVADTWRWDGTDWIALTPPTSPSPRAFAGMAYDFARSRILLFGGGCRCPLDVVAPDTWQWNGADWAQISPFCTTYSHNNALAYDLGRDLAVGSGDLSGQTWVFDGGSWRPDPRAVAPSPRDLFPLAYDLGRGRTVGFGGSSSPSNLQLLDDTWEYDAGPVARWSPFGKGCVGPAGVPVLRPEGGSLPVLGQTFVLKLSGLPAGGAAAIALGFSALQWNGQPLPLDLGAVGMPGCALHVSPDFVFSVPNAGSSAFLSWPLPNNPGLVGAAFFAQGFAVSPGTNAFGAIVSNAGSATVGPF